MRVRGLLLAIALLVCAVASIGIADAVNAQSVKDGLNLQPNGSNSQVCDSFKGTKPAGCGAGGETLDNNPGQTSYLNKLANAFIFAAGIVSFIFIIVSGFRFITATGNPADIKKAKDTLIYAIAGLIVALLSFGIVNFVVGKV